MTIIPVVADAAILEKRIPAFRAVKAEGTPVMP
jgi:hypothetical protein